jgi:hypothetical protein
MSSKGKIRNIGKNLEKATDVALGFIPAANHAVFAIGKSNNSQQRRIMAQRVFARRIQRIARRSHRRVSGVAVRPNI